MITVGIGGGSASGKSWLASYLKRNLGSRAVVICQDWYYHDHSHLSPKQAKRLNVDHPRSIDMRMLIEHMRLLRKGQAVETPRYHYTTHARLRETHRVDPADVVILEGIFVLQHRELRKLLDYSVYIEVPDDIRFMRRVRRDVEERRFKLEEVLRLYEHCVRPMHGKFVLPTSKKAKWVWRQLEDRHFPQALLERLKAKSAGNGSRG